VQDASRAVGVAQSLLSTELKTDFADKISKEYGEIREERAKTQLNKKKFSLQQARANKFTFNWQDYTPPKPTFLGIKVFEDYPLEELRNRIDWTQFFRTWELAGRFPQILEDEIVGTEARSLYEDAQTMLDQIIKQKWLKARAVIGFFPANMVNDDDIQLYTDDNRTQVKTVLHHLRQQMPKTKQNPNLCLADFISPKDDYIGAFAVTAGIGIDEHVSRFEQDHDDYNSILIKALADRLAEAFAERMHERVRKEFWAYSVDENFSNEQLIKESYDGIRPAPGYPACPEHTEKTTLWELLEPEKNAEMTLTDSFAMLPTAAVSGWYIAHPKARYFGIGKVYKDQVEDYAKRKGMTVAEAERWLAPNLGYDVSRVK
jgi:5-methyltetrahydrofolate--homocysteine methyltransferase